MFASNKTHHKMETKTETRTDFLFPKRNVLTGFSNVFSISGETTEFNKSNSGEEADSKAIRSDWEMIGNDLKEAIKKVVGK
jgi:hypothetical protein